MYFEMIDKAGEIENVEDVKRMEGMAEGILERLMGEIGK
jgi:DNA uptake protein ComE-like DNA-binding protein